MRLYFILLIPQDNMCHLGGQAFTDLYAAQEYANYAYPNTKWQIISQTFTAEGIENVV